MTRSDVVKMIKEELVKVLKEQSALNEVFADPLATKLNKMASLNSRWRNFWRATASKYDLAWDKLPKGSFRKVSPTDPAVKKGLAIYVVEKEKDLSQWKATSSWDWNKTVKPGVLAVTVDNVIQYWHGSRYGDDSIGAKSTRSFRSTQTAVGKDIRGTLQTKKIKEIADVVYLLDLESLRGGTTELKAKRAEMKIGRIDFSDPKKYAMANRKRYEELLKDKIGSQDQMDSAVKEVVMSVNDAIMKAFDLPRQDKWGNMVTDVNGKEVRISDLSYWMTRLTQQYQYYINAVNEWKRAPERDDDGWNEKKYYADKVKEQALDLKKLLNSYKAGKI